MHRFLSSHHPSLVDCMWYWLYFLRCPSRFPAGNHPLTVIQFS
nr:MAG TPA: hypothetical protein [Caudoviricetes sp.]